MGEKENSLLCAPLFRVELWTGESWLVGRGETRKLNSSFYKVDEVDVTSLFSFFQVTLKLIFYIELLKQISFSYLVF